MKFVSIIGDSISTYKGFNPTGYSVFYDEYNIQKNGMATVYDTWWAKVNQFLHAYICVNNSYSGSKVSGNTFPSANCDERTSLLHTAQHLPDLILIYIGFNDFGNGIKIPKKYPAYFSENRYVILCRRRCFMHHVTASRRCSFYRPVFVNGRPRTPPRDRAVP